MPDPPADGPELPVGRDGPEERLPAAERRHPAAGAVERHPGYRGARARVLPRGELG
jgi:hypothetical protein